jgi:HSP20 family protein
MKRLKKNPKEPSISRSSDLLLHKRDFVDPFMVGAWTPHVDICQTKSKVVVRAELPGVDASDINLSYQADNLRLQGFKREQCQERKFLCYYCLERRYGRFDRHINIGWVVNPRQARARLDKGILTVELPKIKDRRGHAVKIQIEKK